jgi:hypothetical protein
MDGHLLLVSKADFYLFIDKGWRFAFVDRLRLIEAGDLQTSGAILQERRSSGLLARTNQSDGRTDSQAKKRTFHEVGSLTGMQIYEKFQAEKLTCRRKIQYINEVRWRGFLALGCKYSLYFKCNLNIF